MGLPRTGKHRKRCSSARPLLIVTATICGAVYWMVLASLIQHAPTNETHTVDFSRFEVSVPGELRSERTEEPTEPPGKIGECAINLYGLPRSFKDHVLPSLVKNVISVNKKYQCDYFVHFFNATSEASAGSNSTYSRGGNQGGVVIPDDVYLLREAVEEHHDTTKQNPITVNFASDTDKDFSRDRKAYIDEIIYETGGKQSSNPYFVQEASFTEQSLWNILKMWHSQDRVWNIMEESTEKQYKRVSMLRLDVIYTTPIDVYKVPTNDTIPPDYNADYLQTLEIATRKHTPVEYFDDVDASHCVLPFFKSFPVNDRYFAGPYEAAKIWAKDRFSRARKHVHEILPALEAKRDQELSFDWGGPTKFTDFGLHDERFVAHSLLPEIQKVCKLHADRELYFVRVRADGSIWLRDKPGLGRVKRPVIEAALGRKCPNEIYEVKDPLLGERSPGRWQLKCPPPSRKGKKQKG